MFIKANQNKFSSPPSNFLSTFTSELIDWWGNHLEHRSSRIIHFEGKNWFVKYKPDSKERQRDSLAYQLGQDWTNIAEVRALNKREFTELQQSVVELPEWTDKKNTFLVRHVGDYSLEQLNYTDINAAVASELVFSLWIRRRDTHAANRAYINSVPVFFDHQTAFLGEPHLADIDAFYHPQKSAGHAGNWRVEQIKPTETISTTAMREIGKDRDLALHYIHDFSHFNTCIENAVDHIQNQSSKIWLKAAKKAGYNTAEAKEIVSFLEKNRADLETSIEKMQDVICR